MDDHFYAAIMAGGGGTRLWPVSRKRNPKQSLRLIGEQSLFQMAVQRLEPLIPMERIRILTIEEQAEMLKSQVPTLGDGNFILEPAPRGTASAIGLAAIHLRKKDPQAIMACLTADHFIPAIVPFQELLKAACEVARKGYLVTLGITPTRADIGYGYIQHGEQVDLTDLKVSYQVKAFTEKPDHQTALAYLESGDYLWNSGMFIWHVDAILHEIERQLPELHACLMTIETNIGSVDERQITTSSWEALEVVTVDYGVMEGAGKVVVLPADDLGWVDIGDWSRLFDILPKDELGNVILAADTALLDSSGVFIYQAENSSSRLIAGIGLSDLVIIDTGDALFACPKSRAPEVKRLIESLQSKDLDRYL